MDRGVLLASPVKSEAMGVAIRPHILSSLHAWVEGSFSTCPDQASLLQALGVIRYESVNDRIIVYQEFGV